MTINLLPLMIKDVERLQRYERIFQWILENEDFSKEEIYRRGEGKQLIGKIINSLLTEGAIKKKSRLKWSGLSRPIFLKFKIQSRMGEFQELLCRDRCVSPTGFYN